MNLMLIVARVEYSYVCYKDYSIGAEDVEEGKEEDEEATDVIVDQMIRNNP